MSLRHFDALFAPRAIALVGASNTPGSVGEVVARNLLEGGFDGPVLPVNPHAAAIGSTLAYRSVADLPVTPDLGVVVTPPAATPAVIADLGARGCRAAVVITAGLTADHRQAMLAAARATGLRIIGPNCLGIIVPGRRLNASFAHLTPAAGGLALVSQSGAVAAAILDWAHGREIGFSHVVTIGDAADLDVADLLAHLADDDQVRAILLYVESLTDAPRFMAAARVAASAKPVVVIKAGRSVAGAKAAFSHTGALAGADLIYDAAFRRAGLLRVGEIRDLIDAASLLGAGLSVGGDRLAILTNGGGAGVMAADALAAGQGRLAGLAAETVVSIGLAAPANWSHGDPVDIIGDAPPERYARALEALLTDAESDAILVMNCPTAVADSTDAAEAVIATCDRLGRPKPVLAAWLGEWAVAEGRRRLARAGIPAPETPDEAVRSFLHLAEHARLRRLLARNPPARTDVLDLAAARTIVASAEADRRIDLTPGEGLALLRACGVAAVEQFEVATVREAAEAAARIDAPVALKILSPQISHKSDVGGVRLGVQPDMVEAAAAAMLRQVAAARPEARLDGFLVQPMVVRPKAEELLAGIGVDPTFGPFVMFGRGGTAVEVAPDRVAGLPPLDRVLARDMIDRTTVAARLAGYRDHPPADLDAVTDILVRLAELAIQVPQIRELDINPLLADSAGALALDVRVRLFASGESAPPPALGAVSERAGLTDPASARSTRTAPA